MSGIQTFTPSVLDVTERAVAKVQSLKSEEGNDDLKLRVYVTVSYTHLTLPTKA